MKTSNLKLIFIKGIIDYLGTLKNPFFKIVNDNKQKCPHVKITKFDVNNFAAYEKTYCRQKKLTTLNIKKLYTFICRISSWYRQSWLSKTYYPLWHLACLSLKVFPLGHSFTQPRQVGGSLTSPVFFALITSHEV